ncbi:hypothetical protein SFC50_19895 [Bacillus infantis]|uniref:hypothetical protein n=2 Tax=Bacillaceae TaxID=186817 RepID=UPI003981F683
MRSRFKGEDSKSCGIAAEMLRPNSAQAPGGLTDEVRRDKNIYKGSVAFIENGNKCIKGRITKKVGRIISFLGRIIVILCRKTLNLGGISRKSCISAPAATKIDGIFQRNSSNAAYIHPFLNQI